MSLEHIPFCCPACDAPRCRQKSDSRELKAELSRMEMAPPMCPNCGNRPGSPFFCLHCPHAQGRIAEAAAKLPATQYMIGTSKALANASAYRHPAIQPGDVVTLKGKTARMTVDHVREDGRVYCVWFDGLECCVPAAGLIGRVQAGISQPVAPLRHDIYDPALLERVS